MSLTALCLILLAGIRARLWAAIGRVERSREYLAAHAHFRLWHGADEAGFGVMPQLAGADIRPKEAASHYDRAARLAAIPAGENPANRGVQSLL